MIEKNIHFTVKIFKGADELMPEDASLIKEAISAAKMSYAPYSGFNVGAAVKFTDNSVIKAGNQENAAYPSGMCAERVVLFRAGSEFKDKRIEALAVTAFSGNNLVKEPVYPCGACRQVMVESIKRQKTPFRLFMIGEEAIYEVNSALDMLPLSFQDFRPQVL